MTGVSLIVAMDRKQGIGKDNDLMWHLPRDMKFFKSMTENQVVIMGRKNYDSIPEKYRPLPNRLNVIITRNSEFQAEGCTVFHSLQEAFDSLQNEKTRKLFIIGGGEIYKLAMSMQCVDQMYITHVDGTFDADTFFPEFDAKEWETEELMSQPVDEDHAYSFKTFLYRRKERR